MTTRLRHDLVAGRSTQAIVLAATALIAFTCSAEGDDARVTARASSAAATGGAGGAGGSGGQGFGGFPGSGGGSTVEMFPELWYAVDQLLVLVSLDAADGSVATIQSSTITLDVDAGQTAITMLDDGSLLVARLSQVDDQSHFFHIPDPPRDGSDVTPTPLGTMPEGIMLEGLYTDCDGRVYGMDTGADDTSATGNRLLRFTGDVTAGDFAYAIVSDLATADVADIDDMSPAIDGDGGVTDNPGLAIDSGEIHAFDFETGSGTPAAQAGTYGMHALGGPLFDDATSRLYVLDADGVLFEIDPIDFMPSAPLGTGPTPAEGIAGWSGLAGPLTDCDSGFTPPS
jgi:hypothetical protein